MKKLLLGSVAIIGLTAVAATPAMAGGGVKLGVGGHFKGYVNWADQDEDASVDVRAIDFMQETEVHFKGKVTLDNGLTVGAKIELDLDSNGEDNAPKTEENFLYMSGSWGRAQFGIEDGAAELLQVGTPNADPEIDGVGDTLQPVNFQAFPGGTFTSSKSVDYDHNISAKDMKLTYLSPVMNGFQVGVSYTPEEGVGAEGVQDSGGNALDNEDDEYGDIWDFGFRYEGEFDQVGIRFGAGWSQAQLEFDGAGAVTDDNTMWSAGLDFDWTAFGLGFAYMEDDHGDRPGVDDEETFIVGIDYKTGPFKLGASYLNVDNWDKTQDQDLDRWSAGVIYTYGPGMTFRGSVHVLNVDPTGAAEYDATNFVFGTAIKF